jgi:hypothetical protein
MSDPVIFKTNGRGYWSRHVAAVRITDMQLGYCDQSQSFGELRVYFDTTTWDCDQHGLIYTDPEFLHDLRSFLIQHNLRGLDVEYSEQGMQGNDYVSLDVRRQFLRSWSDKFGPIELDGYEYH